MMSKYFTGGSIALLFVFLLAACGKDNFASKPSLTFKSISTYDVANRQPFEIRLEYTDAEGDLSVDNNSLSILAIVSRCKADTNKLPFRLPPVPATKNSSGEIVIKLANNRLDLKSAGYDNYVKSNCVSVLLVDTTTFLFAIKDKAGNVSDTVKVDRPVLIRGPQ